MQVSRGLLDCEHYTCRATCFTAKHSGRNGRKGQCKGKGIKRKMDDQSFEGPPSNDLVEFSVHFARARFEAMTLGF